MAPLFFALAIRSAKKYTQLKRGTYAALAVRVSGHVDNFLYKAEENIVPHITIQMYPGRDDETKKRLAQAVLETASKELKREKEHFSVSVVDVPQDEWKGKVYDKVLADKNTIIQPGYKM